MLILDNANTYITCLKKFHGLQGGKDEWLRGLARNKNIMTVNKVIGNKTDLQCLNCLKGREWY